MVSGELKPRARVEEPPQRPLRDRINELASTEAGRASLRKDALDASGRAVMTADDPRYALLRLDYLYRDIPLLLNGQRITYRNGPDGLRYYQDGAVKRAVWRTGDEIVPAVEHAESKNVPLSREDIEASLRDMKNYVEQWTPEHRATVQRLMMTIPPMDERCKMSIALPAYQEGKTIYEALRHYVETQVNEDGTPLDPAVFEVNVLLNRPNTTKPFDKATADEVRRFQQEHPGARVNLLQHTFDFKPGTVAMGAIYKLVADTMMARNLARKDDVRKSRQIFRTGGADAREKNPRFLAMVMREFEQDNTLDQLRTESRQPKDALEKVPLFHVVSTVGSAIARLYTQGKSNIGLGSYSARVYAKAGGFASKDLIREEVNLAAKIREVIGKNKKSTERTIHVKNAIDDPRRGIEAMYRGIPYGLRYNAFGNETAQSRMREFHWETAIQKSLPPNMELNSRNLSRELTVLFRQYLRTAYDSGSLASRMKRSQQPKELIQKAVGEMMKVKFKKIFGLLGIGREGQDYVFNTSGEMATWEVVVLNVDALNELMAKRKFWYWEGYGNGTPVKKSKTSNESLDARPLRDRINELASTEAGRASLRKDALDASGRAVMTADDPRYALLRLDYLYRDIPLLLNGQRITYRNGPDGLRYYQDGAVKRAVWRTGDEIVPYGIEKSDEGESFSLFSKEEIARLRNYSRKYSGFEARHDHNVRNRTFEHRLEDHEILLKDILYGSEFKDQRHNTEISLLRQELFPFARRKGLFFDIGPGIANKDLNIGGGKGKPAVTLQEIAETIPRLPCIAVDRPDEVGIFTGSVSEEKAGYKIESEERRKFLEKGNLHIVSGDGLASLRSQWEDPSTNPYPDRPRPRLDAETTIFVRAANSVDIYCDWQTQMKPALERVAIDFREQPVLFLFNREILLKSAGSVQWRVVGQVSPMGFKHNTRTLSRGESAPYTLHVAE